MICIFSIKATIKVSLRIRNDISNAIPLMWPAISQNQCSHILLLFTVVLPYFLSPSDSFLCCNRGMWPVFGLIMYFCSYLIEHLAHLPNTLLSHLMGNMMTTSQSLPENEGWYRWASKWSDKSCHFHTNVNSHKYVISCIAITLQLTCCSELRCEICCFLRIPWSLHWSWSSWNCFLSCS